MRSMKLYRILQDAVGSLNFLACQVRDDDDGDTEEQRQAALAHAEKLVKDLAE